MSNMGRVKSNDRVRIVNSEHCESHEKRFIGAMKAQQISRKGYVIVSLQIRKTKKKLSVHRLVAQAFIPNPNNLPEVNHKNGNKGDNGIANLEWCTHHHNSLHAAKSGLLRSGAKHHASKPVVNRVTGRKYESVLGAYADIPESQRFPRGQFYRMLHGDIENRTDFKFDR